MKMKRSIPVDCSDQKPLKKIKQSEHDRRRSPPSSPSYSAAAAVFTDENLLYEVLKHVDAKTLGTVACVSKQWHRTAQDERLWEQICTENIGYGSEQLRTVVRALGGFRCLHSRYLLPLTKPNASIKTSSSCYTVAAATSSSVWPCVPPPPRAVVVPAKPPAVKTWGKDEIQLSLSLLSVRYFEKLNYSNRNE
ncbi:putative F-box domain-containing protein [Helianthus annuus]|uniref:F-box domain-containing protein n=1 Tax=Helianthus annuus TaxID=4232 RepID=A0A251UXG0_HELAN|nr:F-box protein GID2 [Helianthus annuus]KAF5808969.1 putative F-box domain-containing protein [Helianthus annuus]KAJ0756598.1 putative F-box domain-containing protein [Helianthus annuus]KAJ0760348.1 putative F-box domain-containing protein [Helianthus annuus]KAJ0925598.1 putative F-box domain-containing protein [Helianthus annuus]KAJ0930140.1 putative F-box domain-containing protein [Helianthus annuus]